MLKLMIPLVQQAESSKPYEIAYNLGYFIGSNILEILVIALIILGLILYFAFFRKSQRSSE